MLTPADVGATRVASRCCTTHGGAHETIEGVLTDEFEKSGLTKDAGGGASSAAAPAHMGGVLS